MKIICIGRNYVEHARELDNPLPEQPVFFLKPSTSLLRHNRPFYYPEFSQDIHYELEIVLRISRMAKSISPRFALNYVDGITVGIDFTARDMQQECKAKGLPWEIAKAFDDSAAVGDIKALEPGFLNQDIGFYLKKNDEIVQRGQSRDMIFDFSTLLAYVSRFITLKSGDLLFTGTPAGVGPVQIGDKLNGYLNGEMLLQTMIK